MKNFLIGLGVGASGAVLWVLTSAVGGFGEGLGGEPLPVLHLLMYSGFAVMVGGPLVFWVIRPVVNLIKRRRE
jgi:hypothetical protein